MSLKQVKKHIRMGHYAKALSVLDGNKTKHCSVPLFLRGKALFGRERYREAADAFIRSAEGGTPHAAEAWTRAGICFQALSMTDHAVNAYQRALGMDADVAEARINLCGLLVAESRFAEALPHADWLLANAGSGQCTNAAVAFSGLRLWDKALAATERVLESDPAEPRALSLAVGAAQFGCDWDVLRRRTQNLAETYYRKGRFNFSREKLFHHIAWCTNPQWNLAVARSAVRRRLPEKGKPFDHAGHRFSKPLRVGYVSGDFHDHPFLYLSIGVFERHDPARVQVFAYCHSTYKDSWYRQRFEKAVPNLVRIADFSDEEAASRIRADGIDVLVDCMGFTKGHRQGIFACRPAPVQLTWLGFPGTTGAYYMDYIVADPVVAPEGSTPHFAEHLCRLPETYFANDQNRLVADNPSHRAGQGLPEEGVVFCCMNQAHKLEPVRFATFMVILKDVPGSVLWLMDPGETARANIVREARNAGIDSGRLVFAEKVSMPLHLARLELADIALDTRIYTGHTTTADALWAGLPLVGTRGSHFASRVTESLLNACNMPELVAGDETAMHSLAVVLAMDPEKLRAVREKLAFNRFRAPLFDTHRYTRHLETAFFTMAHRAARGLPPAAIDVPALPPRKGIFATEVPRCQLEITGEDGSKNHNGSQPSIFSAPESNHRLGIEKRAEKGYTYTVGQSTQLNENRIRSNQMHIFTDGIKSVSMSNNNLRITLAQNGPDNTQEDAGVLIIPANQAAAFVNAMANGLKQIDEQVKARIEAQKEAQADKTDVQ